MVLVDSLKLSTWEHNLTFKLAFSFSRCLAHFIAIMSLHASIVAMNSNDFWLVSTFWYSTSNFVILAYKWSRLAWMMVNWSWRVGNWVWYSLFSTKDLSNPAKLDFADSSVWIVKTFSRAYIWTWCNLFFKCMTLAFVFKASLNVVSFLVLTALKACHNVPITYTYILETWRWSSKPCRKDCQGKYSFSN